ncbi:ExeM/NucH family extracellular endonuclease [Coralloluteibacterium thermophilus]|uniref:ExeM/NucH family extracellular endonuclease n=1 Tax=Coralloluteibacterium thermophilum TaxID=2707049 RepID=A0ABV9NPB9_9GAMM
MPLPRLLLSLLAPLALAACQGAGAPAGDAAVTDAPVVLAAPPTDWSALDGRRVRIEAPLTVSGSHRFASDGELVVAFDGRLRVPTEIARPGPAADAVAEDNARRRLTLALDGAAREALAPRPDAPLRTGTVLEGIEGELALSPRGPRLQVTEPPATVAQAERPAPPQVEGTLRIAALNLLNLFNGDGRGGGFPTPRGARTPEAYAVQQAKLVEAVTGLDAHVLALMEVENDGFGPDSALVQFAAAVSAASGHDWRVVDAGAGPGGDAIRVALMYRADRVRRFGAPATLSDGPFAWGSRAPLAQAFVPLADGRDAGQAIVVAVNHFKSKGGCGNARGGDADQGDGQACFNAARVDSARRLAAWLADDPTGADTPHALILGDLNAYAMEDPMETLAAAGWRDAFAIAGGEAPHHSFVWDAQAGRLDHALVSPALAGRLRGAAHWHINSDEASVFGYAQCGDGACPGPWASSDHDPLLLGIDPAP